MDAARKLWLGAVAVVLAAVPSGCGTPGAPQPPSLNLPDRVTDLAALRAGDRVSLTWTMPKKNTDKILLKGEIPIRVCRREGAGRCEPAGSGASAAPGAKDEFTDTLPSALAEGAPRALSYFVELTNRNGRSAGQSNAAVVLAGKAPAAVADLKAVVRKEGVELEWTADATQADVRLERRLLTPRKPGSSAGHGPLAAQPERPRQNLMVDGGAQAGRALDKTVRFGETYEYRAQHLFRVAMGQQTLELGGEWSNPVRADVLDIFPPAAPTGLAAVATAPGPGAQGELSIDLSWQPVTEPDLAGYIVYRRGHGGEWQRISPEKPVVGPAFHDAQVERGRTYEYAVTAIDQSGHESARSAPAEETTPDQ
jgi:hypothetical protein